MKDWETDNEEMKYLAMRKWKLRENEFLLTLNEVMKDWETENEEMKYLAKRKWKLWENEWMKH